MTFDQLPDDEKTAIRSAIRAVNAVGAARSEKEIEAQAFANPRLRAGGRGQLYQVLHESAKRAGWSDQDSQGARLEARYDEFFRAIAVEMRAVLAELVRTGTIPYNGGWIAPAFLSNTEARLIVSLEDARARISSRLHFKNALGLIAFVILKVSELSAEGPPLLQCAECGIFKIIQSTGGDKPERFCSTKHRNRFNVRKWRAEQKQTASARKAK
jgi:hypothetical protein